MSKTLKTSYIIDPRMLFMESYFQEGMLWTKVIEVDQAFYVSLSPHSIVQNTLSVFNEVTIENTTASNWLRGMIETCPVIVDPLYRTCVFPFHSLEQDITIWFNPNHIEKTSKLSRKNIRISFRNGLNIVMDGRHSEFNHKLNLAREFSTIKGDISNKTLSFMFASNR